jgi:hypothetical protein
MGVQWVVSCMVASYGLKSDLNAESNMSNTSSTGRVQSKGGDWCDCSPLVPQIRWDDMDEDHFVQFYEKDSF